VIVESISSDIKLFGYEHLRLEILKKLRTASLNSEFTGSVKKVLYFLA